MLRPVANSPMRAGRRIWMRSPAPRSCRISSASTEGPSALMFNHNQICYRRQLFQSAQSRLFSSKKGAEEGVEGELSIEEQYSRKTPLEHVLLRPGMYVGSNQRQLAPDPYWVIHKPPPAPFRELVEESPAVTLTKKGNDANPWACEMAKRDCQIAPALIKVFDEILVNASDNHIRDPRGCTRIDVTIDPGDEKHGRDPFIRILNNGKSIPVEIHKQENMYVPEMLFGHLMTGSNFNDETKRVTGGRHGYGAKLTNIFSKSFTVEVADQKSKKLYKQTWNNNMKDMEPPEIVPYKGGKSFTSISFVPDMPLLTSEKKASALTPDEYALMCRRVVDIAGFGAGKLSVCLNGHNVDVLSFDSYIHLFRSTKDKPVLCHKINSRWSVGVGLSPSGSMETISFVNGMSTDQGGTHVAAIEKQITVHIQQRIEKLNKALRSHVSLALVRQHLFIAVHALIDNPTFDSQMKEKLSTSPANFGSRFTLSKKFLDSLVLSEEEGGPGIVEEIVKAAEGKEKRSLEKIVSKKNTKHKMLAIPKLEDAHLAGTQKGKDCTLVLTEGDSAKALAIAGLEVVGRERFGVFPLRGKFLNVRGASAGQLGSNAEVKALCSIMGLNFKKKYKTVDERKTLRYGSIMLMTDQDNDGSHIKGLVINFFRHFWPHLLQPAIDADAGEAHSEAPFLSAFQTPLLKARKGKNEVVSFYSTAEFNKWRDSMGANLSQYSIKYYKGLGTSTPQEAKEYFAAFQDHVRPFTWTGEDDGEYLDLAFDKDRAEDRRTWINDTYDEEETLYSDENSLGSDVSYQDFINRELIHFSNADNIRSIPSVIDGLKPAQRKVLFACFKRNLKSEMKVAQLSGYCAEHTAYHHGEASLQSTIIGMAQDFIGSNNINLLVPSGQFGTRLIGGTDAASPRYIFTQLSDITRVLFPEVDDALLSYLEDDGQMIEPEYFAPIIPLLLINGTKGIGTGWSSHIPHHSPRDVVHYLKAKLDEEPELPPIRPFVRGFTGTFDASDENGYISAGRAQKAGRTSVLIDELPVGRWTEAQKNILLKMREKDEIKSFVENHTTTKVSFTITMEAAKLKKLEKKGFEKSFKLTSSHATTNMHAFDSQGKISKYDTPESIADAFYPTRFGLYEDRISIMRSEAEYKSLLLENKSRFIEKVVGGDIKLLGSRSTKQSTIKRLNELGFASSTDLEVVRNNNALMKRREKTTLQEEANDDKQFDYLLNMQLSSLTSEKMDDLRNESKRMKDSLAKIRETSPRELWHHDLDSLLPHLPKEK